MSLGTQALFDAIQSHAMASGLFSKVNTHEPKSAPAGGAHCAIYVTDIRPATSGLAATSAQVSLIVRIYHPMLSEPQDQIDPDIVTATDTLIEDYSADFELGGNARNIDLMSLNARAGYIDLGGTKYRSMDITIPIVVNDAFTQVA